MRPRKRSTTLRCSASRRRASRKSPRSGAVEPPPGDPDLLLPEPRHREVAAEHADRGGDRRRARHHGVGAAGDPVAAGRGDVPHRDDHRHFLGGLDHLGADDLRGDRAAARRVDPEDHRLGPRLAHLLEGPGDRGGTHHVAAEQRHRREAALAALDAALGDHDRDRRAPAVGPAGLQVLAQPDFGERAGGAVGGARRERRPVDQLVDQVRLKRLGPRNGPRCIRAVTCSAVRPRPSAIPATIWRWSESTSQPVISRCAAVKSFSVYRKRAVL